MEYALILIMFFVGGLCAIAVHFDTKLKAIDERMRNVEKDSARNDCRIDCLTHFLDTQETRLDIQQVATTTINGRLATLETPRPSMWRRIKGRLRRGR